jgi:hypothetical protein
MTYDVQWGGGPTQLPIEIRALDAIARGAFDQAELERRTAEVRQARTVAQLLAATADPSIAELSPPSAVAHQSRVALLAGVLVAVVLALVILAKVL